MGDVLALQRSAGNHEVTQLLARGHAPPLRRSSARTQPTRDLAQREGPYEIDFGKPRPPNPSQRKLDQDRRLRGIQNWLTQSRTRMAWLGLFDQAESGNAALAEHVEWLTAHISSWIEIEDTLPDPLWEQINATYMEASTWLNAKSGDRWKDVDALIALANSLNLQWAAAPVQDGKREVEQMVASGTAPASRVNARMRALQAKARDWPPLLDRVAKAIEEHISKVALIETTLEQFDDTVEKYETLMHRKQHIKDIEAVRKAFNEKTQSMERTRAKLVGPTVEITVEGLVALAEAYEKAAQALASLDKGDVFKLGVRIEEAEDKLPLSARTGGKNGRTSLPKVDRGAATALPNCEMLIPAVKEATKTPEWRQAAVDFTLGLLATGRPDHIHICGGGNTLVYKTRLIRGYMTVHLDSRPESQLQFKKILYRDLDKKVKVAVQGGVLKEVI